MANGDITGRPGRTAREREELRNPRMSTTAELMPLIAAMKAQIDALEQEKSLLQGRVAQLEALPCVRIPAPTEIDSFLGCANGFPEWIAAAQC